MALLSRPREEAGNAIRSRSRPVYVPSWFACLRFCGPERSSIVHYDDVCWPPFAWRHAPVSLSGRMVVYVVGVVSSASIPCMRRYLCIGVWPAYALFPFVLLLRLCEVLVLIDSCFFFHR